MGGGGSRGGAQNRVRFPSYISDASAVFDGLCDEGRLISMFYAVHAVYLGLDFVGSSWVFLLLFLVVFF